MEVESSEAPATRAAAKTVGFNNNNYIITIPQGEKIAGKYSPRVKFMVVVAKIYALLRRAYSYQGETTVLTAQGAVLELGAGVLNVGGAQIELTKNELKILRILMEHKNSVVTREEIMQNLWDSESFVDDNTLTVNINRLRKKLSKAGLHDFIATKKGVGYWIHD